jgi:hypothetical protein
MKRIMFAIIIIAFSISSSYAQSFDGVQISGNVSSVIEKFKAKGYTNLAKYETSYKMNGKLFGEKVELWIHCTPVTKQTCKVVVYFPKRIGWQTIKSEYFEYRAILIDKYGDPESSFDFFSDPYYEGDGYEMNAVQLEKCTYASFWDAPQDSPNTYLAIRISEFSQVSVSYENQKNRTLREKEKNQRNKSVF